VIVTPSTLEVRGLFKTSLIPRDTITRADVAVGPNTSGYKWEHLVLHTRDGSTTEYKSAGGRPSRRDASWLRSAAEAINDSVD
jgi:hypothetical protein